MKSSVAKRSVFSGFKPSLTLVSAFAFSGLVPAVAHQWNPGMPLAQANGMALVAWGAMYGAYMLAGTLASARNGKPLGKKFASIWLPIETVLTVSLMIPLAGSAGQTMAQAMIAWVGSIF